jgi:hypothetical protein
MERRVAGLQHWREGRATLPLDDEALRSKRAPAIEPSGSFPVAGNTTAADATLAAAAAAIYAAAQNEETRFSNLNTRGVAVLSATSLVTALAGIFGKDLLATTSFVGWQKTVGIVGLIVTLVLLVAVAWQTVEGVLVPHSRALFGGNALTDTPTSLNSADEVQMVIFNDYRQVNNSLALRNAEKAQALESAYRLFLAAVLAAWRAAGLDLRRSAITRAQQRSRRSDEPGASGTSC